MYFSESDQEDEFYKLIQKGFYVQPPSKTIGVDTIVRNGSDFIHRSRLQDASLKFSMDDDDADETVTLSANQSMRLKGRKQAEEFSRFANELLSTKQHLQREFPKVIETPNGDEKEWCIFCHGSELYSVIFGEEHSGEVLEGHQPALSILLHLTQREIKLLVKYHYQWFKRLGMEDALAKWLYALLSCLEKPVGDRYTLFLEVFYNDCRRILKSCEESKKEQLHYISAILGNYFCVKFYKIGPSLEKFKQ